jgi:hypothetical protein
VDAVRGTDSRSAMVLVYGGAAAAVIAIHLATNSTLAFHTGELYYHTCGWQPANPAHLPVVISPQLRDANVVDMCLRCARRHLQVGGDLLTPESSGDEARNFGFAPAQRLLPDCALPR